MVGVVEDIKLVCSRFILLVASQLHHEVSDHFFDFTNIFRIIDFISNLLVPFHITIAARISNYRQRTLY